MKMHSLLIAEIVIMEMYFFCVKIGTISVIGTAFVKKRTFFKRYFIIQSIYYFITHNSPP